METVFEKLYHASGWTGSARTSWTAFRPGWTAKAALHNFCIRLNRQQGRPSLAFVDLLGGDIAYFTPSV